MSTQKRESRWQRRTCMERAGVSGVPGDRSSSLGSVSGVPGDRSSSLGSVSSAPGDRYSSLGWSGRAIPCPAPIARYVYALANGGTAPLVSIVWSMWAWLATKFLQSDQPIRQLVQPALKVNRRGSPPPGAGRRAAFGIPASPRSSLPPIPFPSGFAPLHQTLPQAPVGYRHRAERYDGKRDMYFLHAA